MRTAVVSLLLAAALGLPSLPAPAQDIEPPSRVGRVSLINGTAALYSDPQHGWEKAYVNSPLTSENSLWTEPRGRVEVRIGSTTLRLDETTQLDLRRLGDEELRAHLVRGSLAVRIRHLERGERYYISTPNAQYEFAAVGRYRIDADEDRAESRVTVFEGRADVEATRRASAGPGESILVADDGSRFEFERTFASPFDDWALLRDEIQDRAATAETTRYVSPNMTGYEDLGSHGSWSTEPEHGPIWYPTRVGPDYVPYRDGRWVYMNPWGWTWVDNAPWGYAPFHYGRWVYTGNRWGWCPGRYVARPVWAPALVGWVGSSGGFTVAVSSGRAPAMGWYPLSPYDRYRPWYTNNTAYINNVNVIVNRPPRGRDDNHYRDRNRDRGSTVVLREDFVQQRPVAQGITRVSGEAVREAVRAPVAANPVAVLPPRTAVQRPQAPVPVQGGTPVRGEVVGSPPGPSPQQPRGQTIGGAPVGGTKPSHVSPAPPPAPPVSAPPARVGGEAVRAQPPQQVQPGQQAQPAQPQPAPAARPRPEQQPALRARPAPVQPVEVHEAPRPAPQQAQPPQQLQPRGQVQGAPQPAAAPAAKPAPAGPVAKPAPAEKPATAEKPAPAEKPAAEPQPQEKPGRSSGTREK